LHYHHSCALSTFDTILRNLFVDFRDDCITKEIKNNTSAKSTPDEKLIKNAKKKHAGSIKVTQLITTSSLAKVIAEYERVKWFEFEYTTLTTESSVTNPLSPWVKKKKERLFFGKKGSITALGAAIQNFVDDQGILKGRLYLHDKMGDDHSIKLFNMPHSFGCEDYDVLAERLDGMEASEFHTHDQVKSMIKKCTHEHKAIYGAKIKN
jgi:hypothetical protein